ncbi:Protein transport protein Sec31A [Dissostichus eleginoides]|uniref:Protein transport protein Sec31A n=1 Tax=Dissostichus eleginoides TaxID=100907 RepID=A0AAD9BHC3_DISEL|nr:Protein transport protein Sec31A [Dissostichus eleginoides]
MKLKEINRTAIQSWSPAQHHPIYLATGTSAQQLDASFSTNASLEFFELDLSDPSLDMKSCGSLVSSHRYHKLVWGPYGIDSQGNPSGVLVAGGENGNVILYDPAKIMAGETDVIIAESDKHTGPVRGLDVNPFQTNLVASGGNESEIYIWDMNNFGSPMTPGPKTQPLEDISCVSWNRQVQHILASASPSGRASVWDLRKNDLIIKVSDHSNRMHCSGLAWNPEVATQLVLSSEDDRMPVIQMWDLRFASSPLKILENHTRGVLSIAWSLADPDLLLSCGKDNRILCWNPNTAEVLYELPTSSPWCFDIQWCPRNPAVLSAASFDGHIDIYSIMGGTNTAQSQRRADQITNSFGNMDPFGTGQTLPPLQLPPQAPSSSTINPLKKPPKWIRRPVGASFAFGGKLVSLENSKPNPQQPQQRSSHVVHVSQVVIETAFLKRSDQLQATLSAGSFVEFCQEKIDGAENEFEKTLWSFLKANFESDIRSKYLELLGYNKEELALKISAALEEKPAEPPQVEMPAPVSLQSLPDLSLIPAAETPEAAFDMIAAAAVLPPVGNPEEAFDMIAAAVVPPAATAFLPPVDNPEEAFDLIAAAVVPPAATAFLPPVDNPEEAFDMIAAAADVPPPAASIVPPAEIPLAAFDMFAAAADVLPADTTVMPPAETPEAAFDMIANADVSLAENPEEVFDMDAAAVLPSADTPEAAFDMIAAAVVPPADPLEAFDMIAAAANLEPAATLELDSAPDPETEEPAAEDLEVAPAGESEENMDQVLPEEKAEEEEIPLDEEEEAAPVEEEPRVSLSIGQDVDGLITQALLTGDFEGAVELCLHDNRMADSIILAIAGGADLLEKTQKKYFTKKHSKITKLISAVVLKDWHEILTTCELQNWKEALAAVMTYAEPEKFSSLCDLLGDRLEAGEDAQLQAQAFTRWHCPLSLQDLVEKVVVLRRAVEQTQHSGPAAIGILLAEKMSQYANLLASQGSLTTAITYLPDNTNQVSVQQLRDRLSRALGQQAAAPAAPAALVQTQKVQSQPPAPTQPQPILPRPLFTPVQPAMVPQPRAAAPPVAMPTPAASAPAQPQYYQPVRAASTVTSWSNQTPTALPHHPPPPSQVGRPSEQQVEPSNQMYGMPPPGTDAQPPVSSTPAYMYSHQYQPYPQVNQYHPGAGGGPVYQPLQYSSAAPPAEPAGFLSHYTQPTSPVYPGPPPISQISCVGGVSGPQNGWNDPPALNRASRKKSIPTNYTPPTPITAPIMAPLGADPQAQPVSSGAPQVMGQGQHGAQTSMEGAPGAPTGDVIQPLQSIPAEKIMKKPIPDEHLILKTTFEGLIQKCLAVAMDPQTKRKLDDANKRLEALYDKLREQTLSPAIVGGLHNIARSVESRSYTEGLKIHTHIVSSSNFSETSAFMPVLKVVLTQANKLGV